MLLGGGVVGIVMSEEVGSFRNRCWDWSGKKVGF